MLFMFCTAALKHAVHGGQPGSYAGYVIDKLQKRLRDAKHWLVRLPSACGAPCGPAPTGRQPACACTTRTGPCGSFLNSREFIAAATNKNVADERCHHWLQSALKTLMVFHRLMRENEGASFVAELLRFSGRGYVLNMDSFSGTSGGEGKCVSPRPLPMLYHFHSHHLEMRL